MSHPLMIPSRPSGIQAVIFDLNGVLTSDMNLNLASLNDLYGITLAPEAINALWWPLYLDASLGKIGTAEMWLRTSKALAKGAPPRKEPNRFWLSQIGPRESGLTNTLGQLRRHYVLGVMSNHIGDWARALLRRVGLLPMLDGVLISSDVGIRKPDPRIYVQICGMLRIAPEAAVYVADEEEDLEAAAAVGMTPVFIPGQSPSSNVGTAIGAVSELPSLLRRL